MIMQESGEMYLESILIVTNEKGSCRSIDVCEQMGYSKPSVSRAVGLLRDAGYIRVDREGYITLTSSGRQIAEKIYERHTMLTEFLIRLGVDEKTAAADACRMEHSMSDETFEAIKRHATAQ